MRQKENAAKLEQQLRNPVKLCVLWEWRDQFYEIPEEAYMESPILSSAMTQIKIMEGRLDEAERYLEYTRKDSRIYSYTKMIMPNINLEQLWDVLQKMIEEQNSYTPNLTLSASRPELLNGVKDFTKYGKYLRDYKEQIVIILEAVYGDAATGVYEIALAEHLYQKDECFEALVMVSGTIPLMEDKKDLRALFAALCLEMNILIMNGQASSAGPLMAGLRKRIEQMGSEELQPNLDALEAVASMYDGHLEKVDQWIETKAPDEYADFNMLDTYRYMVKLRCYLIQGKYMALFSLAERLKLLLEKCSRKKDMCEVILLTAMSCYIQGKDEQAFEILEQALMIAAEFRYDRLIGDEGKLMYRLLYDYRKSRGSTPYLEQVMAIARKVGLLYPNYLKQQTFKEVRLSGAEKNVLNLIAEQKSNAEIGEYLDISLNTVKFHTKNIYKKLGVKSRGQAVLKAKEAGMIAGM